MKRWILGLFVIAATWAGTAILIVAPKTAPPRIAFPDGETVALRQVSWGTNHLAPKPEGWPLPRIVRFWLYRQPTFAEFHDTVTAKPSLVLWIENTMSKQRGALPTGSTWVMLADAAGHTAGKRVQYFGSQAGGKSRLIFSSWPEASPQLTIRWFKEETARDGEIEGKLIGEWNVPNPAYRAPILWEAEAIPASHTNGTVRCTLERVLFGLRANAERIPDPPGIIRRYNLSRPGEETGVVLISRFDENVAGDSAATNWEVGRVVIMDSAGNMLVRDPLWVQEGETIYPLAPALWPEHPWELRIFAKRRVPLIPAPAGFSADELLTFRNVPLNGPGETVLDQESERGGAKLKLRRFILREPKPTDQPWQSEEVSELGATLARQREGVAIDIVGVLDDEGVAHYPRAQGFGTRGGADSLELTYSFPTLRLKTASLTFIFAIQNCREFRFHISPEIATSPLRVH